MSGFMTYAIKMTTQNMQWPFWALDTTPLKVPTSVAKGRFYQGMNGL